MENDDQPLKMVYTGNYPRISWQSLSLICYHQTCVYYYHCKFRANKHSCLWEYRVSREPYNYKPVTNYTKPNK